MTPPLAGLAVVAACLAGCQQQAPREAAPVTIGGATFDMLSLEAGQGATLGAGDFDEDGHVDIVASGAGESDLVVLRGDGTGGLVPDAEIDAGPHPAEIAVADVDGDGHADVLAANHETRQLTLLSGDGAGGFAASRTIEVDVAPHVHFVVARDLDGDGVVDLAVDHRDGEGLLILSGRGEGDFGDGALYVGGGDPYRGMAAGDLNGDGQLDFVTPNPREVGVLLSTGGTPYELRRTDPVPATLPFAVGLADLDADGRLDLVAASGEGADVVQVFRGDGAGGFEAMDGSPIRAVRGPKRIVTGDFDGDGVDDVAVSGWQSAVVHFLFGSPDGFHTATASTTPDGAGNAWGLVADDLNADGRDDLVVADGDGPRLTLFLSTDPNTSSSTDPSTEETP